MCKARLDDEEETELLPQDARRFRSIAARCNFLAADRVDIQFACKEVRRRMSTPCEFDGKMLKSIAYNLRSHLFVLLQYKYQDPPLSMEAIVDTDFAGCRKTRKSTNGGCVMHGMRLIKSLLRCEGSVRGHWCCEFAARFDWPSQQCTSETQTAARLAVLSCARA